MTDLTPKPEPTLAHRFPGIRRLTPHSGPDQSVPVAGDKPEQHGSTHVTVKDGTETDRIESIHHRRVKPVNMQTVALNVASFTEHPDTLYFNRFAKGVALLCGFINAEGYHKRQLALPDDLHWPDRLQKLTEEGIEPKKFLTDYSYLRSVMTPSIGNQLYDLALSDWSKRVDPVMINPDIPSP